jgi:polysaccharide biosynthesis PFTS motif protein
MHYIFGFYRRNSHIKKGFDIFKSDLSVRSRVLSLLQDLSEIKLPLLEEILHNKIWFIENCDVELLLRQFLNKRYYRRITLGIFASLGSGRDLIYPIPREVHYLFYKHNIRINVFLCKVLWGLDSIICFFYGIYIFLSTLFEKIPVNKNTSFISRSAFFVGFKDSNWPSSGYNQNIVTWFLTNYGRHYDISNALVDQKLIKKSFCANESYRIRSFPILSSLELKNRFRFIFQFAKVFSYAVIAMMKGNFWFGFIFSEIVLGLKMRNLNLNFLPRVYVFSNSFWLLRPYWTYYFTNHGGRIVMYFYSTNAKNILTKDGKYFGEIGTKTLNFNDYIVWDNYQMNFLRSKVQDKSPNFFVVNGEIPFVSTKKIFVNPQIFLNKNLVCTYFPVEPFEDNYLASCALPTDIYSTENSIKALCNLVNVINGLNGILLVKTKRAYSKYHSRKYIDLLKSLSLDMKLYLISHDSNVESLCKNSTIVFGHPFTSAVKIAKFSDVKCAYYSSDVDDLKFYHGLYEGIPILTGEEDLKNFIKLIHI